MSISSSNETQKSLDLGDSIGLESSQEANTDLDFPKKIMSPISNQHSPGSQNLVSSKLRKSKMGFHNYPPMMPYHQWELKKHTTGDGRVVIELEKVHRRVYYLHSERANGCLTLTIVDLFDSNSEEEDEDEDEDDDDNEYDQLVECSSRNSIDDLTMKFSELSR
ncbi:hypothetical protein LIER_21557 [Lithospermum erythrorhizon]|uniref:FAF domain-containing protein n=1 Tax=Lithospermum erythrorhizon TaxID=34254 RepID=A0AAV3QU51_LITER